MALNEPQARPVLAMSITKGSPLAQGRLPATRRETADAYLARFDPVSLAALLCSIGRFCSVAQAEHFIRAHQRPRPPQAGGA